MTGRDLIIYISTNKLEDVNIFDGGVFIGFKHESSYAEKLDVGIETVRAMVRLGMLQGVLIGDSLYIWDSKTPLETN